MDIRDCNHDGKINMADHYLENVIMKHDKGLSEPKSNQHVSSSSSSYSAKDEESDKERADESNIRAWIIALVIPALIVGTICKPFFQY